MTHRKKSKSGKKGGYIISFYLPVEDREILDKIEDMRDEAESMGRRVSKGEIIRELLRQVLGVE